MSNLLVDMECKSCGEVIEVFITSESSNKHCCEVCGGVLQKIYSPPKIKTKENRRNERVHNMWSGSKKSYY